MERQAIIFIGLQASGKSTFYKKYFFNTHLRLSMDLLNTRNKEKQFIDKCIDLHQSFVIDNTNPSKAERARYLPILKARKYKKIAYYFHSSVQDCMERNALRTGKDYVQEVGIFSTVKKLEKPSFEEGFDQIFWVEIQENTFRIKEIQNEI